MTSTLTYEEPPMLSTKMVAYFIVLSMVVSTLLYLYHEYLAFISLGPGGTPQTVAGFLRVFLLSFMKVSNPYESPTSRPHATQKHGYLRQLSHRDGPRPDTRGIAPHRQMTQKGSEAAHELLVAEIERLGSSCKDIFIGTSCFEKHSTGLFALHPVNHTCRGEVCHTHPSDGGSMHLALHPADVNAVLESGRGERHPLARGGCFERFVPAGFVMVYAPRIEREVRVLMEIVDAAAWYVRGGKKAGS